MQPRFPSLPTAVFAALAAACGAAGPSPTPSPTPWPTPPAAPRFELSATDVLSGDDVQIALRGFAPGTEVELVAERPVRPYVGSTGARKLFRAHARFRVAADGSLALATAAPLSGSYDGADLRGLFWSMTPTQDPVADAWSDERVELTASQGGRVAARAAITLRRSAPGVEITPVGPALPGAMLARLAGATRRPAIIVLGGSEGSDWTARDVAPRLASHGYAVLGLPYYAPSYGGSPRADLAGLPTAFVDIPVDRLDQARAWLRQAPGVDADHIAIWGFSKGAEFALLAAAHLPWVTAVVAIAPSDVVWEGWGAPGQAPGTRSSFSWRGEPLAFVPYANPDAEFALIGSGTQVHLRRMQDNGRAAHPEAAVAARIPIERYHGALLLAGAGDDQTWASGTMAASIARSRAAAGLPTTTLIYPDAGHLLGGDGWAPTTMINAGMFTFGGTPAGNARAQAAVWHEVLALLGRALGPPGGSAGDPK
ncbi:MAG: acyl-CoA thioester hydrolase/BAAT C-terminal domain-containing protein [Kofleriaceae bacterium]